MTDATLGSDAQIDRLELLKQWVDANPCSPLFISLGDEYKKRDMFQDACAVMEKGIEQMPDLFVAYIVLARWYIAKKMYDDAGRTLRRLLERDPGNAHGHKLLGHVYSSLGLSEEASQEYARAYALHPFDEEITGVVRSPVGSFDTGREESPGITPIEVAGSGGPSVEGSDLQEIERLASEGRFRQALALLNDTLASDTRTLAIIRKRDELMEQVAATEISQGQKIARLNTLLDSVRRHFSTV